METAIQARLASTAPRHYSEIPNPNILEEHLKSRKLLALAMMTAIAGSGSAVLAGQGDRDHQDRDHQDRDHEDRDHDNGHWRDARRGHKDHDDADDRRGYGFAEHDRGEIRNWYAENHRHLPPGLARRDYLPPDQESRLVIHAAFPGALESRVMVVPADLDRRMGPPPPDCERVIIGGHIVLRNRSSRVIVDIFHFE